VLKSRGPEFDEERVFCKPWRAGNTHRHQFRKQDFHIDLRRLTITCPGGETEHITPGSVVEFDPEACAHCKFRDQCTMAGEGKGRRVSIAEDEALQKRLRKLASTPAGRDALRRRVPIEHRLAHIVHKVHLRARLRIQGETRPGDRHVVRCGKHSLPSGWKDNCRWRIGTAGRRRAPVV
jgi:hypothetical protein